MKIIKQGQLPQNKRYRSTCSNCGTRFEFKAGEAKFISDQCDGGCYEVKCPYCQKSCFVSLSNYVKEPTAEDYYNK